MTEPFEAFMARKLAEIEADFEGGDPKLVLLLEEVLKASEDAAQAKARHVSTLRSSGLDMDAIAQVAGEWRAAEQAAHDKLKEYMEQRGLAIYNREVTAAKEKHD